MQRDTPSNQGAPNTQWVFKFGYDYSVNVLDPGSCSQLKKTTNGREFDNSTSDNDPLAPDEATNESTRGYGSVTATTTPFQDAFVKVGYPVNKTTIEAGPTIGINATSANATANGFWYKVTNSTVSTASYGIDSKVTNSNVSSPTNGIGFKAYTSANVSAVRKGITSKVRNATVSKVKSSNVSASTKVDGRFSKNINGFKSTSADCPNAYNVDFIQTTNKNYLKATSAAVVKDKKLQKVKSTGKDKPDEKGTVEKTIVIKGKAPVDPECVSLTNTCHVFWEGDNIYDVMLNHTNLEKNNNKFAWLQLLEDDRQTNYYFWCRSGRVGYPGRKRLVDCGTDFYMAKDLFETEFRARTRNSWQQRHSFRVYPGKPEIVFMDYNSAHREKEVAIVNIPKSTLYFRLQSFIELIFSIKEMEDIVTEMKYDAKNSPLGKLTAEQVAAGHDALVNISECIAQNKMGDELREACNIFYTRIPHSVKMKRPPLISTTDELHQKFHLLKMLDDIQVTMAIINEKVGFDTNPLDSRYRSLKCDLIYIPANSSWYRLINEYLQNTHGHTHVGFKLELVDLFHYHRQEEESNFNDVGNKTLLWHGTRLINSVRILKYGLKIAPLYVQGNGKMFGEGVYFADMSSKSANYCYATPEHNEGILYLCEVALGNQYKLFKADHMCAYSLPEGYHSVMGLGSLIPNPSMTKLLTEPSKVTVPLGTSVFADPVNSHLFTLNYNEYVVYNVNQIKIQYVLRVKFLFQ